MVCPQTRADYFGRVFLSVLRDLCGEFSLVGRLNYTNPVAGVIAVLLIVVALFTWVVLLTYSGAILCYSSLRRSKVQD